MPSSFLDLVDDVLLSILASSRISAVLSLSQTCRHLKSLAFDKYVWVSLVEDLAARFFVELPPAPGKDLHQYSTIELIDIAKRTVRGPKTWTVSYTSQILSSLEDLPGHSTRSEDDIRKLKFLPGGRYVLVNLSTTVLCWSVCESKFIWDYEKDLSSWSDGVVCGSAAEIVDNGRAMIIVICQIGITPEDAEGFVKVIRFQFGTGQSSQLMLTCTPESWEYSRDYDTHLCGDYTIVGQRHTFEVLLINWKTQSGVMVVHKTAQYDMALIRGHLIFIYPLSSEARAGRLDVYNLDAFSHLLGLLDSTEPWNIVKPTDIPCILSRPVDCRPRRSQMSFSLFVHESPLQYDVYTIWGYFVASRGWGKPILHKYSLSLTKTPAMDLSYIHVLRGFDYISLSHISYSGHACIFDQRTAKICVLDITAIPKSCSPLVELPHSSRGLPHSAYSGAIITSYLPLVITYFE